MNQQQINGLYFEDIVEGMEPPPLIKKIEMLEIVRFGALTELLATFHIDKDYARKVLGFPDVSLQGGLKIAMLSSMLTNWCGATGNVKKISCQYRGMDYCGDTLSARARVTKKYVNGTEPLVECDAWIENQKGERKNPGTALLTFPLRLRG